MDSHRKEISRVGVTLVETCGCGMIYLGVGPVTVKLSPEAFSQLVSATQAAQVALQKPKGNATILPFERGAASPSA